MVAGLSAWHDHHGAAVEALRGVHLRGLVALEEKVHGRTLLTLDRRADATYRRLGVAAELIALR